MIEHWVYVGLKTSWGERAYLFKKKKVVVENSDCEKECWKIWHNQKQSMKLQRKKEEERKECGIQKESS